MFRIEEKAGTIVTTLEPIWVGLVGLELPGIVPVLGVIFLLSLTFKGV